MDAQRENLPANGGHASPPRLRQARLWPLPEDAVLVACCRTGHGNTHAGVVFRDENGRWMLFHQAWHRVTLYEPLAEALSALETKGFAFAVIERPAAITDNLVRFCRSIASVRQAIPFAFGFDSEAHWDQATGHLNLPKGIGLTCVNFAIVLFKQGGVTLIDWTDWPSRPEDKDFQADTLATLTTWCQRRSPSRTLTPEDEKHLTAVKTEIESEHGCARIRSEELVGAILTGQRNPTHDAAIPAGATVTRIIDAFTSAAAT